MNFTNLKFTIEESKILKLFFIEGNVRTSKKIKTVNFLDFFSGKSILSKIEGDIDYTIEILIDNDSKLIHSITERFNFEKAHNVEQKKGIVGGQKLYYSDYLSSLKGYETVKVNQFNFCRICSLDKNVIKQFKNAR